jgi:hypothetical protein
LKTPCPDSTRRRGVFSAAYALLDSQLLSSADENQLRELLRWFGRNLPVPKKFDTDGAIFWFKSDAGDCARRIWGLVLALRQHSYHVDMFRTRRPGYVVYEDEFQVGAIPFQDTWRGSNR